MNDLSVDDFILILKNKNPQYVNNQINAIVLSEIRIVAPRMIKDENFKENKIKIDSISYPALEKVSFDKCSFKTLEIGNIDHSPGLELFNCEIEELIFKGSIQQITIMGGMINHIIFTSSCRIPTFVIEGIKDLSKNNPSLKKLILDSGNVRDIHMANFRVEYLKLSRTHANEGSIDISNLAINEFSMLRIDSGKGIKIKHVSPLFKNISIVKIENSVLDSIYFEECNFKDFKHLEIRNSDLSGVKSRYVLWFKKIIDTINGGEDISSYRQLKSAMQKQFDGISETYFRAKEHNAYRKRLNWLKNFNERFLLTCNMSSNYYGLSWNRGVLFTLISSVVFFSLYTLSLQKYPYTFGWTGINTSLTAISDFLGYLCRFFIITHDFDFMQNYKPRGYSYAIDTISRIVIGYGVYQTIQAFRKYGK